MDNSSSMDKQKRKRPASYKDNSEKDSPVDLSKPAASLPDIRQSKIGPAPYSDDEEAKANKDQIDYSKKITKEIANSPDCPRAVRVYADGIYDMFHSGHARQLMQAKSAFPNVHLLVGVCNDELTHYMKGRTVMNEKERYEAVRHCRYVDELVPNAPWVTTAEFLEEHKIDFVAHDDLPYGAGSADDIYKWLKDRGQFVATQRTEGISTTDVITRIIKDYDVYVRRNLARGYTARDLNVSYVREKTIQLQSKVDTMKDRGKQIIEKIGDKRSEVIQKWEEKSREYVGTFMEMFGRDGRLNQWINEGRMRVSRAISPTRELEEGTDEEHSEDDHSDENSIPEKRPPMKRAKMSPDPSKEVQT